MADVDELPAFSSTITGRQMTWYKSLTVELTRGEFMAQKKLEPGKQKIKAIERVIKALKGGHFRVKLENGHE